MRILVINPNTSAEMTADIGEAARRYASPGTEVDCVSPRRGPRSIEGYFEDYLAASALFETVVENDGRYDGFVVACYGDPGLHAARELTDVPVVGIAEASMHMACMVAHKFTVVTILPRFVPVLEDLVRVNGMRDRVASIRATALSVLEIEAEPERAAVEILREARAALQADGAEAICLGCAGMGPLDKKLQQELGVPVIDGVAAAVQMLEGLHRYGIRTSKVGAFSRPQKKELVDCSPVFARLYGG